MTHPDTYGSARVDHATAAHAFDLYSRGYSLGQVAERVPAIAHAVPGGMWAHRATYAQEVIQDYVGHLHDMDPTPRTGNPGTAVYVCQTPPPRQPRLARIIQAIAHRRHQ